MQTPSMHIIGDADYVKPVSPAPQVVKQHHFDCLISCRGWSGWWSATDAFIVRSQHMQASRLHFLERAESRLCQASMPAVWPAAQLISMCTVCIRLSVHVII